MTMLVQLAL